MRIIEITESKVDRMSELAEEMLSAGGKLMSCISELSDEGGFGERRGDSDYRSMSPMRRRGGSEPMRMRDDRWRDDYDGDGFGERRGRLLLDGGRDMYREPLDIYDERPQEMVSYLRHNGMHFNGKAQRFASSLMRKRNPATGKNERIETWNKDQVDEMLKRNGITLDNATGQDYVFVANMAKADFLGSSIEDEAHLARYVKDVVDDPDQADGFIFNRWYADMVRSGIPVDWEGIL